MPTHRSSPLSIINLVSKVGVQGEPIPGQGYDRGDKVSPSHAAVALVCQPQALQLQRYSNGQTPIHRSIWITCRGPQQIICCQPTRRLSRVVGQEVCERMVSCFGVLAIKGSRAVLESTHVSPAHQSDMQSKPALSTLHNCNRAWY